LQGSITGTGVAVYIPCTATGTGTLPAYSTSVDIDASLTQDGKGCTLIFSWPSQTYYASTVAITAYIRASTTTLNAKKLDINTGLGSDYLGVLLGTFTYQYNRAGQRTTYQVRAIPGIPDKMFGKYDIGNTTSYEHNFLYSVVTAMDGNNWLTNNLGADYANLNSGFFNLAMQATSTSDTRAVGSLFQWGRCPDGHELINWSTITGIYTTTPTLSTTDTPVSAQFIIGSAVSGDWRSTQNSSFWATESSANNPCPRQFRIPTEMEYKQLFEFIAGGGNWSSFTKNQASSYQPKFPASYYIRDANGGINNGGSNNYYLGWAGVSSSTIFSTMFHYTPDYVTASNFSRATGAPVRCFIDRPATVSTLSCTPTNSGTLMVNSPASGVTSVYSYTGGNGAPYPAQSVSSTGVTGLTANLPVGMLANGAGTLTYTITGVPTGTGTASFAINFLGQSCTLNLTVISYSIPSTITLAQNQNYFVASVYDQNYLPYTLPAVSATTTTPVNPDGTTEAVTVNVQGSITTTGVTVKIPVTATASGTLPAFSTTITIPASITEDGLSRDLVFSWASQAYTAANTRTITATIQAVGGTLNAKKLDINTGVGNDCMGVLMGAFNYPYNNAGATTSYSVRDIPGIPDKIFGQYDIGNTSTYEHNFLYVPVTAEDGRIWLNNNLGADYANLNKGSFNLTAQATAYNDNKAYGSLFQWGRCPDGHELITWTSTTAGTPIYGSTATRSGSDTPASAMFITNNTIPYDWRNPQNDALWATVASANNPCPSGFRLPTVTEATDMYLIAGIVTNVDAANSILRFTANVFRHYQDGSIGSFDYGKYWTSLVNGNRASIYSFAIGGTGWNNDYRGNGFHVRCIKN